MQARIRWLKTGAILTIGCGILIAAAAIPALQLPTAFLLDLVYFPLDQAPDLAGQAARLLSAITGGLLIGWGVSIWLVATELYPRDPALGRRIILFSVGSWFIVDSAMSIAAGGGLNVVLNLSFLLIFALPVWKPVDRDGATAMASP